MAYLRLKDYYAFIQADQLQQVIRADDTIRTQAEFGAEEKIREYLVQKYDLAEEFTDTLIFSNTKKYQAGQLVDLNFTPFAATSTYDVGDLALYNSKGYICKTAIGTPAAFDASDWTLLGNQYDLFNIPYPYPVFDYLSKYVKDDRVYYKGKVYQCLIPSGQMGHSQALQYSTYGNIPINNIFPDNSTYGTTYWGTGIDYSITGLLPNAVAADYTAWSSSTSYTIGNRVSYESVIWEAIANSTDVVPDSAISKWQPVSWLSGDNRNPNIVESYIDITLYKVHKGIAPRNIPELRVKAYDDAIDNLEKYADGRITLNITKLQPLHGNKIRFNGNIKNTNNY